jgi:cytochrome c551/c552
MKYIILITSIFLFINCDDKIAEKYEASTTESKALNYEDEKNHPGKKLMENNCYVCHNPTASEGDRIGPPMIAIKKHYKDKNTTKEDFVNEIIEWVREPSVEKSKMPGAVRRFNLMPYQSFPEEDVRKIANYIYDYEIEQPEWFKDHFQQGHGKGMGKGMRKGKGIGKGINHSKSNNAERAKERGLGYALSTKTLLGQNLMASIQKKGTLGALAFCNVNAQRLTDSMSRVHKATIRRVSDKARNSKNKANVVELQYLEKFKNQLADKKEVEPIIYKQGEDVHFYYPIITNTMCLQCHGGPNKEIKPLTLKKINELYPNDLAIGYSENEVRGIWSISFNEKE